ncbi:helix-turn-helix domain-containing protein [Pseudomaricurvus sp. HS19]|uniref:helix-turn-helix domain-containing protein n=1 Tax=Pseudomaricurvus sp. HS19 TaxID=2692626 RepID=UPI00136CC270|nr:helix-turn-helix domain-containing protein [Pseudomaricurvus sp. HS19]MYM62319.1 helix-turn-helix domain-containing protein [Pseudomaricurvus sp. HS19]
MSESAGLGTRLRVIREFYGWSQRELGKRAGVPNSAISVIEQGTVSPSIQSLEKVLKGFPLSLPDFFAIDIQNCHARVAHTDADSATRNHAVHYHPAKEGGGHELYLRTYCRSPADPPLNLLSRGQTLVLLLRGEAMYRSTGSEHHLRAGSSLSLNGIAPFRLEPEQNDTEWVVACLPKVVG